MTNELSRWSTALLRNILFALPLDKLFRFFKLFYRLFCILIRLNIFGQNHPVVLFNN